MCSVVRISAFAAFFAAVSAVAPNSVHINLDTFIRVGSRENIHKVFENITSFLDKLKYALLPTHKDHISRARETKAKYFTNFVNKVAKAVLKLKDEQTIWFFTKLYEEIKYYLKYKGSAFADIVKNPLVKRYLEDILKEWAETAPYKIKRNIRNYITIARNKNDTINRFGDFIDNFYNEKDEKKMQGIVNKLKNCRKEKDFAKVISAFLHNLVIKHYDNLNYTIRTEISDEINRLSEYAIKRRAIGDFKSTSKMNDNSTIKNNTQTIKEVLYTVKSTDRDTNEDTIAIPEKGYVANDIEIIKNKYSHVLKDNFMDSDNNTVLPQDTESNTPTTKIKEITTKSTTRETVGTSKVLKIELKPKVNMNGTDIKNSNDSDNNIVFRQNTDSNTPTKKRLKKITKNTTREIIKTSKALKRFKLKPRPKENINGTDIKAVPQDINDANTTVPLNISNGTDVNTTEAKYETYFNANTVAQNINTATTNIVAVPSSKFVPQNSEKTHDAFAITSPVLRVNKEHFKTTESAVEIFKHDNIPRNNAIGSLPIIPVPIRIKSTKIPELRVFGNKKHNPKTAGKVRKFPKKVKRKKVGGKKKVTRRKKKKSSVYVPPQAKKQLARLAKQKKRLMMMDIEDIIDAEGIDGK